MRDSVIGVIDSGVGGLTVVKELMRQLPRERIVYYGDSIRCPYGPRTPEEIRRFTFGMIRCISAYPLKLLVIACNTATAAALEDVREVMDIPVIGVIDPGSRAAIKVTQTNRVGVIGTQGTINSGAYTKALKQVHPQIDVVCLACPALVPLVERGASKAPGAIHVVEEALQPLKREAIDCLILGCTHYPVLSDLIQQVVGEDVKLISSAEETAREVSAILDYHQLLNRSLAAPEHVFYTSGDAGLFRTIAEDWLEQPVRVLHQDWAEETLAKSSGS